MSLVAFVLLALACGGGVPATRPANDSSAPADSTPKDGKGDGPRDPAKDEPDFRMPVGELLADLNKLGFGADKKYKNKIVEVSGEVGGGLLAFGWSDEEKTGYFSLTGEGAPAGLTCYTAEPEPWAKVVPGQKVTVKGRWGNGPGRGLVKCVFVQTGPYPGVRLTAEQLCRDVRAEADKYDQKYLVVSGEIRGKQANADGGYQLELKGDGVAVVRCTISAANKNVGDALTVGQKLKMFGKFDRINQFDKNIVWIVWCLPVTREGQ
jgi:hypothetical protein